MKEIVVVSGKGGVGKTSVAAALAILFHEKKLNLVALDADVDAPNLALLLSTKDDEKVEDEIEVSEKAFILSACRRSMGCILPFCGKGIRFAS